jgi:hypothetical protein
MGRSVEHRRFPYWPLRRSRPQGDHGMLSLTCAMVVLTILFFLGRYGHGSRSGHETPMRRRHLQVHCEPGTFFSFKNMPLDEIHGLIN